jgi:putative ABC transport system permease protein
MLWTTLQGLIAHRFRLFATALAVTLGVAFTAGTLILTDTITRNFDGLMGDMYAETDAVVRGEEQFDGPMNMGAQRPRIDEALLQTVLDVDGVEAAEGTVSGYARIVGKDGKPVGDPNNGAPTFGVTWTADERLNPLRIREGREPRGDGEVAIDVATAESAAGYAVGDTATVLVQTGPVQVRVVGTVTVGSAKSLAGATMAVFARETAQQLLAEPGKYDEIAVVAADGVSQEEITARIDAGLPAGAETVTGIAITEENQDFAQSVMRPFTVFMGFFAGIALLVGAFMIFNAFSITVAQRTRENGLLRALGASRRQVLSSVLVEALAVGVLASLLGLGAGFAIATGLNALIEALGFDIPSEGLVFAPRTVVIALVAGVTVTLVAAVSPARKAAKVAPIAAMSSHVVGSTGYGSKERVVVGTAMLTAGVAALLTGLFADAGSTALLLVAGAVGLLVGVLVLGRTIALPLSRLIGAPLPRVRGLTGELARENAMRNPKRTANAAAALMIGVAVVGIITIFVSSIKGTIDEGVDRAFTSDLVVDSGADATGGVDPTLAQRLDRLPEVAVATGLKIGPAVVDGDVLLLGALDPARAFEVLNLQPLEGSAEALGADGIAVLQETAQEKGLQLGDTVPVRFKETGERELTVGLIYGESLEANGPDGTFFLGTAAYEANFANPYDWQVYVKKSSDAELADVRAAVDEVVAAYPGVDVTDKAGFAEKISAPLDPMLGLVYALLGLSILIALLGIGNTLALSIVERTRELGLLRAVGMTRSQLRSSIRWESVIIAVQGTLLGLVLGVALGWAFVRALADEGIDVFRVPTASLLVIVALGALAGMLAAVLPSRRAAKLDILRAVATE